MVIRLKPLKIDADTDRLGRLSIVSAIVVITIVVFTLFTSMSLVTERANQIDDKRAVEAMQGAITQSADNMAKLVLINSVWDDAVRKVYAGSLDKAWLYASYGALATPGNDYDNVYIVAEDGAVLWSHSGLDPALEPDLGALGPGAGYLLSQIQKNTTAPRPITGLSLTRRGLALIGIGPIVPSLDQKLKPKGQSRYLVLTRMFDSSQIARYEGAYAMRGLRYSRQISDPAHVLELKDAAGASAGYLAWTPRHPGYLAAQAAWPRIATSLALVSALIACLFAIMGISLKRLARSRAEARRAMITDPLTGLPNRRAFMFKLSQSFAAEAAILLFDVDHFKVLNDTYGHKAADAALVDIAGRLSDSIGAEGYLARLSGDQFGVLIGGKDCSARLALLNAEWARIWEMPVKVGATQIKISGTGGFTCTAQGAATPDELFQQAELALSHAKTAARGRPLLYVPQMDKALKEQAAIAKDIRNGLCNGEFSVVYQPIVDCQTNMVRSVEALVRWPGRSGAAVGPDIFIPIAESDGSIHQLGMFVLSRACCDLKPQPNLDLGVNLSPVQFADPRLLHDISSILSETGFEPWRLVLEITEGHLIDLPEQAEKIIADLHQMGVRVALDDFGVGYSSIGYLRRFVFDKLKIDKSLCDAVTKDPQAGSFLAATVAMARALGIPVTAEGVETIEQASLLRLAGCDQLQGYLYGRPESIDKLAGLLGPRSVCGRPAQA